MKRKIDAILDLVRVPNLFTAPADSVAGFFLAGGEVAKVGTWLPIGLASVLLYAGGVTLNDVCDAPQDACDRPQRPIPRGAVTRGWALQLATFFLLTAVAIAWSISIPVGAISLLLAIAIVLYDAALKPYVVAPFAMGLCRALNLLLGIHAAGKGPSEFWLAPLLLFLYASALTFFARHEGRTSSRIKLAIAGAGMVLSTAALILLRPSPGSPLFDLSVLLMVMCIALNGLRALRTGTSRLVQQAVKNFVLAIIGIDSVLALAAGVMQGLIVLSLLLPAVLLARRYRVT